MASQQKSPEAHVLFKDSERSLYLNGAVHAQQDTFLALNALLHFLALPEKGFGYMQVLAPFFLLAPLMHCALCGQPVHSVQVYTVVTIA
nr:hypothetical protein [Sporomusa sp. KB1]